MTVGATDPAHFERLVAPAMERLWRYAYRLARREEDAEDLMVEALAEGFRSFDQFRGDSSIATWMYRIITTTWLDMRRKEARRHEESLDAMIEDGRIAEEALAAHPSDEPEASLLERTLSEEVERAMDNLSPEYRAVLVLADIEQMDYKDVAKAMNIPVGTVRSRLHRARQALQKMLEPYFGSLADE